MLDSAKKWTYQLVVHQILLLLNEIILCKLQLMHAARVHFGGLDRKSYNSIRDKKCVPGVPVAQDCAPLGKRCFSG